MYVRKKYKEISFFENAKKNTFGRNIHIYFILLFFL